MSTEQQSYLQIRVCEETGGRRNICSIILSLKAAYSVITHELGYPWVQNCNYHIIIADYCIYLTTKSGTVTR